MRSMDRVTVTAIITSTFVIDEDVQILQVNFALTTERVA